MYPYPSQPLEVPPGLMSNVPSLSTCRLRRLQLTTWFLSVCRISKLIVKELISDHITFSYILNSSPQLVTQSIKFGGNGHWGMSFGGNGHWGIGIGGNGIGGKWYNYISYQNSTWCKQLEVNYYCLKKPMAITILKVFTIMNHNGR